MRIKKPNFSGFNSLFLIALQNYKRLCKWQNIFLKNYQQIFILENFLALMKNQIFDIQYNKKFFGKLCIKCAFI